VSDRCPYCSFQPTSMSDYCEEHRPGNAQRRDADRLRAAFQAGVDYGIAAGGWFTPEPEKAYERWLATQPKETP
jgi:hypothetical protein